MTTAIIGTGNIGKTVARTLVNGGERVAIASRDKSHADKLALELGNLATSARVREAIAGSDVVVLAVWFATIKELIKEHGNLFSGKVVVDPSNPLIISEDGELRRILPEGTSAGMVISKLLKPIGAHYVKAFSTLGSDSLASSANKTPQKAVMFYATDDDKATKVIDRLITTAGFEPVKVGGVKDTLRIEAFGDLNGELLNKTEAEATIAKHPIPATGN